MAKQIQSIRKRKPEGINKIISRTPIKPSSRKENIYISKQSKFKYVLKQVKKLLFEEKIIKITLHGLGARTLNAINMALMLEKELLAFKPVLNTNTSTVKIIEDLVPEDEEEDIELRSKKISAVHIELSLQNLP